MYISPIFMIILGALWVRVYMESLLCCRTFPWVPEPPAAGGICLLGHVLGFLW